VTRLKPAAKLRTTFDRRCTKTDQSHHHLQRNFNTLKIITEDGVYGLGDATLNV
jgi:L-alanine-DL-glutamate epimerase-like enolase superfamily enzyme